MAGRYYSLEERLCILERSKQYTTLEEASKRLGVGIRTLGRWKKVEHSKKSLHPRAVVYTEQERKNYAIQAQNYTTWIEASAALGPTNTSLREWCNKYGYPFPQRKNEEKTDSLENRVTKKKRSETKSQREGLSRKKRELSEDLKEGIANMVADHVPEKTMSRLTGIPKSELREVISHIMGSLKTGNQ